MRGAGGDSLGVVGARNVQMQIEDVRGKDVKIRSKFTIGSKITKPIISLGEWVGKGCEVTTFANQEQRERDNRPVGVVKLKGIGVLLNMNYCCNPSLHAIGE